MGGGGGVRERRILLQKTLTSQHGRMRHTQERDGKYLRQCDLSPSIRPRHCALLPLQPLEAGLLLRKAALNALSFVQPETPIPAAPSASCRSPHPGSAGTAKGHQHLRVKVVKKQPKSQIGKLLPVWTREQQNRRAGRDGGK